MNPTAAPAATRAMSPAGLLKKLFELRSVPPCVVAAARGLTKEDVLKRVRAHAEGRTLGILGEPRVNVLMLNLDLDGKL